MATSSSSSPSVSDVSGLKIAVVGCAVRNTLDLNCMSLPQKYRSLGDFHKYYSGKSHAPVLTLVIGGNHEASNYFYELYYGGWLAPNIYYLGAANVIRYGPCRIAGLSGIFKDSHFRKPHGERIPYSRDDMRSIYHVREYDVRKLLHVRSQVDIGLSHDWPAGVELFGDYKDLFASKPHFFESARSDRLGNKPAAQVLSHLRPKYWFSGHMHARFEATVKHTGERLGDAVKIMDISDDLKNCLPLFQPRPRTPLNTKRTPALPPNVTNRTTEFLALDKAEPNRKFLELKKITMAPKENETQSEPSTFQNPPNRKYTLQYDEEWLAITRAFAEGLSIKNPTSLKTNNGKPEKQCVSSLPNHKTWIKENIVDKGLLEIPKNFAIHAPVYNCSEEVGRLQQPVEYPNSQTHQFCGLLQIPNLFQLPSLNLCDNLEC